MKKNILFLFVLALNNNLFTMSFLKKLVGFKRPQVVTENNLPEKLRKQIAELAQIKKDLIPTIEAIIEAKKQIALKLKAYNRSVIARNYSFSKNSIKIGIQFIEFELSEVDDFVSIIIKNMFDNYKLLGQFEFTKSLYDPEDFNLLYSHMLDFIDFLMEDDGFVKTLSHPKIEQENPETVKNLKPEFIVPSKDFQESILRFGQVIKTIGTKLADQAGYKPENVS